MNLSQYEKSMTNLAVSQDAGDEMTELRISYKAVLNDLFNRVGGSRERTIALERLEESLMWAIKAIALENN